MYERLASIAQSWGLITFVVAFLLVLVYALLPSNAARFRAAAATPLRDDDLGPDAPSTPTSETQR